ncbi:MAG: YciI family protein [Celeribacter sp.]|jgi:uncharacterized protein YciI
MSAETPEETMGKMLGKALYVVTTSPARGPGLREVLPAHLEYQVKLEREGKLFGAGPLFDEGGEAPVAGMIVLRAGSYDEARALADQDPFHAKGLRSYTIQKWKMNEGAMTLTIRYSDQSVIVAD